MKFNKEAIEILDIVNSCVSDYDAADLIREYLNKKFTEKSK